MALPLREAWVQSLLQELRSLMPHGTTKLRILKRERITESEEGVVGTRNLIVGLPHPLPVSVQRIRELVGVRGEKKNIHLGDSPSLSVS